MEPHPAYTGDETRTQVQCACGRLLWLEVASQSGAHLEIGGLHIGAIDAICQCGKRLVWRSEQVRLERLLRRRAA